MHRLRDIHHYCEPETWVRDHSWSSKVALFDRAHMTLYSSSIVTTDYASIYYRFRDIATYWLKIATPLYFAPPLGVKPSDWSNDPWWTKTRMMGLSDNERILMMRSAILTQIMHVTNGRTDFWCCIDGQTDGIGVACKRYSIHAVARKKTNESISKHNRFTSRNKTFTKMSVSV